MLPSCKLLTGCNIDVSCLVTSKEPVRAYAVGERTSAIQESQIFLPSYPLQEYARRASSHEEFIDDKTTWIDDRLFSQQRLAGNNPLSIKRVTIHGEGS